MRIMNDVNLDKILVNREGKAVRLEFINMQDGGLVGFIECEDVLLFNYHNVMDAEGLAIYVGHVDVDELVGDAARTTLAKLGFGFRDSLGRTGTTESGVIQHLHVEGGEVSIDLCCGQYHLTRK